MAAILNLALLALGQVLNVIAEIKSQGGLTDDAISAAALKAAQGNDLLYAQMIIALNAPSTAPAKPAA